MIIDRTEWPTAERLESLRAQGIVPVSRYAVRAGGLLVVLGTTYAIRDRVVRLFERAFTGTSSTTLAEASATGAQIISDLLFVMLVPIIALTIISVVLVLLQTKFLFVFSRISFDLSRLNRLRPPDLGAMISRVLLNLSFIAIFFVLFAGAGYLTLRLILPLVGQDLGYFARWPGTVAGSAVPLIVGALMITGFTAWIRSRFSFMLKHRMSREEVLREGSDRNAVIPV